MNREWDCFSPAKTAADAARKLRKEFRVDHGDSASRHDGYDQNPNTRGRKRSPAMSPSQIEYDRTLRGQRGFQAWTERWAVEMYRVLKPGAYLLVSGAPRSFHRMTCGVEDAGFHVRDCLAWIFGQGFPKSRNLGDGKGTALKPAWEPIVVAQKPFRGSIAKCHAEYGTAVLNIDACRLEYQSDADKVSAFPGGRVTSHGSGSLAGPGSAQDVKRTEFDAVQSDIGRWPPNVAIDDIIAEMVDEQSGELSTGEWPSSRQAHKFGRVYESAFPGGQHELSQRTANVGGASRFFYCAKPSREERDLGCDGLVLKPRDESRKAGKPGGDNPRNRGLQLRGNFHPCLPPGEVVLTEAGFRPIETIRVGDRVYAGDGTFRHAIDVFTSPCDDHVVTISIDGSNQVTRATTNHPFLVWRPTRKNGGLVAGNVGWYEAGELSVGDYTLTPVHKGGTDDAFTLDQAWAFGLWIAEGAFQKAGHGANRYPTWTLHANETTFVERLRRTFRDVRVYGHGKNGQIAMVFDAALADQYERLAGRGARSKRLALDVFEFSDDVRREIVAGYFDGDGSVTRKSMAAKTASADLATTMAILAESVGYHITSYFNDPSGSCQIEGRTVRRRPYWQLYAKNNTVLRRPRFIEYGGQCYSIRRIKQIVVNRYTGPVWNLTVDQEHTFQTRIGLSHNTVKPVALMRWLVRLVSQPGAMILDPFTGSGTTGMACKHEMRQFVGIEREAEFVEIAQRRIEASVPLLGQMLESATVKDDGIAQSGLFASDD